jgi:hypothetical protein
MRPKIGRSLAIPVIAAAAIVPVSLSASASPASGVELRFDGTVTSYVAMPARSGGSPQHPGDEAFFDVQLTQNGRTVGHSPHHCTAITADDSLCESVIVLDGGQVTLQTALGATNTPPVVHVAVTGGTGAYRNAQGELTLTANPDGSQSWDLNLS